MIFKIILKTKIDFKCEIKIASRWQKLTGNKWVIATEPNHLNDWIIQERITETQNIAVAVWNDFFGGEMEQKQAIWYLKRKSLDINLLFIELLYKINTFVIMLILKKKRHPLCDFNYVKRKYIHFLPPYLEFCDNS